jgi:single-strand DNA-binding protein
MVNRVILIGNLGKDPEFRMLDSGAAIARFSLATNENYRDKSGDWQQTTEWHDIVVWRNLAERANTSLKKGMTVYVEGKLTHRSWQDQDGNTKRTTEVVASYFRVLDRGASSGRDYPENEEDNSENNSFLSNNPSENPQQKPINPPDNAEDDLPF